MSGVTAAVEIAEVGRQVILVEEKPYLGGNVIKMNNYFPKLCPPSCGLEINFRRIRQNSRIKCFTSTTVKEISGEINNFRVKLLHKPNFINNNCTACGNCTEVCPEERPNEFDYGFSKTKAIYLPHEMAFPMKYSLDVKYCKKESCNKCVEVCDYDAINLSAKDEEETIEASSVIIATGWKNPDAAAIKNLGYKDYKNVITNVEFERLIDANGPGGDKLLKPSDGKEPKEIAFVQCAGSRDENYLPYCSAVCCSASLKHALSIQNKYPDSKVKIFYIDLRVSGRNEDFLRKVEENKNIELIKGKVAKITESEDKSKLVVEAEDMLESRKIKSEADLVVLATGITPNQYNLNIYRSGEGFISDKQKDGIYPVACCKRPMDVSSSVKDATAAALKSIQLTS